MRFTFFLIIIFAVNLQAQVLNRDSFLIDNKDSLIIADSLKVLNDPDTSAVNEIDSLLVKDNPLINDTNTLDLKKYKYITFSDSEYVEQLANLVSIIDLTYNQKVKAFINLYANKRRPQVAKMIGLSEYYFPIIEEYLDRADLPLELKYLPIIESALNTRARSRAGAVGLWQFMYGTGKIYGLEINSYVDERMDPVKSTIAATKFLKDLYAKYKDWTLVIAAYNCGPGNVNKAIKRSHGKRNFWEIYYRLPRETRGYVPAFIAANYIMNYYDTLYHITPEKYNLNIKTDTIIVNEFLHLKQVAEVLNIPIETLRNLNPQYKRDIIPAKTRTYPLRLPEQYTLSFIELKDSIFNYKDSIFFNDKNKLITPPKYERYSRHRRTHYAPPPTKNMIKIFYTVKPGDNVGYIASWYKVRVNDIRYWNNLYRDRIRVGQKLVIYKNKNVASKFINIDKMSFEQKQKMVGKKVEKNKTSKKKYKGKHTIYTVKRGDNFWTIAKRYPGVSNYDIMKANGISDPSSLKVGQKLIIPQ